MSEPIVFISTNRIKPGKLDGLEQLSRQMLPLIEAGKPRTVLLYSYLNEERDEVTFVHVFPDAEAMDLHFQGADERSEKAYEFIEPRRFEIYGRPSDKVLSGMRQAATQPGIDLMVTPRPLVGFIRLASG